MKAWATLLALLVVGCSDNGLTITVEASPWTATQIPRRSDDPAGLEDGYTVVIEKLLFVVSNVELEGDNGPRLSSRSARVFNAKKIGAHELARFDAVKPGTYQGVSFDVAPASIARSGNADARDVELMTSKGWSVYVEGVATKKFIHAFRWGFDSTMKFERCGGSAVVRETGVSSLPLVAHGERFFAPGGFHRFRVADRDDNRYTTMAELETDELVGALRASMVKLFDCSR